MLIKGLISLKSGKKSSKKGSVLKKISYVLISLLGVVVILMSVAYGAFYHYYSKMNIVDGNDDFEYVSDAEFRQGDDIDTEKMNDEELEKLREIELSYKPGELKYDFSDPDIINIMIAGTDSRLMGRYRTNADSMVLVTINKKTKKIFFSSFMRDILVDIPKGGNHKEAGKGKLNAAFGYGGHNLMFKTYEKNFGIKLDKYVHVDFFNFINIVNYLDGVDMYLTAEEIKVMNEVYLYELNCIYWHSTGRDYLPEKSGTYHLNGKQTLAYTRVRYVGGGDFGRTERQRKVIAELMKKVKSMSAKRLSSFAERCLHYVTTNISQKEVMSMALHGAEYLGYEQVNARIPIDKTHHSERLQGTYVLIIDLQKNADYWYNLVYLDKDITEDIYKAIEKEKAEAAAKKKADKEAKKADEDFLKLAAEAAAIAGVKVSASDSTVTESSQ